MPTKNLLVTEIDAACSTLCNAERVMWHAAQKKVIDESKAIMEDYLGCMAQAVAKIANVKVVNARKIEEFTEFKSRKDGDGRYAINHRTAFVVDADGDGRLAELWRQEEKLRKVYERNCREFQSRAHRLKSDLRLVDRCREGDKLHKQIVTFVQNARRCEEGMAKP